MTSQTLIRESEHKEKTKSQYDEEKKKYHYLANSKDKEISDLMALMENMKRMHEDELKVLRAEKLQAKSDLDGAYDEIKRVKEHLEEQLKLKDEKMNNLTHSNE